MGKRTYDELWHLKNKENLDPMKVPNLNANFLAKLYGTSPLSQLVKTESEILLIEFHDILPRNRLNIGGNTEFKINLTPKHDTQRMYTQRPSTPIHLKEDLLVELALMQCHCIVTTLPHSKYSSPLFAHSKPSGALPLLIDLRRVNHLISYDYVSHKFQITSADASAHLAGKKFFAKLDCSQAYLAPRKADTL